MSFSFIEDISGALARVFDIFWLLMASWVCFRWRFGDWSMPVEFQTVSLLGSLIALMSYSSFKVYESWRGRRKIHLFGLIVTAHLCAFALLMGILVFSHQSEFFSRLWLAGWIALSMFGVIGFRIIVYELLDRLREKGLNHKQLIFIGDVKSNKNMLTALEDKPWLGLEVVKVFVTDGRNDQLEDPLAVTKNIDWAFNLNSLIEDVKSMDADEVWISLPLKDDEVVKQVLYELRHSTVNIRYFPSFSDLRLINHKSTVVAGMPAFDLSCSPLDGINHVIKSFEDRLLGMFIFTLIAPLMLIIAI